MDKILTQHYSLAFHAVEMEWVAGAGDALGGAESRQLDVAHRSVSSQTDLSAAPLPGQAVTERRLGSVEF